MPVISTITVQDPVDVIRLFGKAREVAGADGVRWHLRDLGTVHMLVTLPDHGATAQVSVRFPAEPGAILLGDPGGYADLSFGTDGADREWQRRTHWDLTSRAGAWLTSQRLRWSWSYDGQPWAPGYLGPYSPAEVSR